MDRREFLKQQAMGALWLSAGSSGLLLPKIGLADTTPDVSVVKGPTAAATRAAVEMIGGMRKFVKSGNRVIIKPNMSFSSSPRQATNTHPDVVRELAIMCKEAGASKILVLDHTLAPPELCLNRSGIRKACESVGRDMVFAVNEDDLFREVNIPLGESKKNAEIPREVLKSDVLIAAPVAKSHSATGVSLSMKGMMGLIWSRRPMHVWGLDTGIVDICTLLKADLTVIDGSRVLSTNGPRGPGKVLIENTIIASKDMVAADAYAVSAFIWYGKRFKPRQVGHILKAHERGLGRMDLENLTIKKVIL